LPVYIFLSFSDSTGLKTKKEGGEKRVLTDGNTYEEGGREKERYDKGKKKRFKIILWMHFGGILN
jgi:hypothetical protein